MVAGKFRLTRQLGQGGMGLVWAAVHETLGREVAVKFLQPQRGHSPSLTDRFVSEAHMVASIKHRFVVDVFDYGVTEDGIYYMVLELLHGRSLADRMDHGPAFQVRQAVQLMADCLRGLAAVHDAGIIHRDLKPDNIFVIDDADGLFPKLIDFGISRRTHPANLKLDAPGTPAARTSRLTQPGTVLGTPYYMSPEQLRGRSNIDCRADVYAVGVILYELLAGRLPFEQDNVGDLMVAITVTGAPSLLKVRPELGEPLSKVIQRALAPNADERYTSALELREALLALLPKMPAGALSAVQSDSLFQQGLEDHTSLQLQPAVTTTTLPPPPPANDVHPPARSDQRRWWIGVAGAALLGLSLWPMLSLLFEAAPSSPPSAAPAAVVAPAVEHTLTAAPPAVAHPEPPVVHDEPVDAPNTREPDLDFTVNMDLQPSAATLEASEAPAPRSAQKPQRSRARSRDARPSGREQPQKLYRKLDF